MHLAVEPGKRALSNYRLSAGRNRHSYRGVVLWPALVLIQ